MGVPIQDIPSHEKDALLKEAVDLLCETSTCYTCSTSSSKENSSGEAYALLDEEDGWEDSLEMDELITRVQSLVQSGGSTTGMCSSGSVHGSGVFMSDESTTTSKTPTINNVHPPLLHKKPSRGRGNDRDATTKNNSNTWSAFDCSSDNSSNGSINERQFDNGILNNSALWKELDDAFAKCDEATTVQDQWTEFQSTEDFVQQEQVAGRQRRTMARAMEAKEESRLAVEVAQLKGLRLQSFAASADEDLRWKISNAERSYKSRKMVYAKASQVAAGELRLQFARVRGFLEQMHKQRQVVLYKQHRRNLNFQALMHTLKGTDARMVNLERQISQRLYRKKKADLNELHMTRTLEEAVYLESMMDTLDKVQLQKEVAARELFDLHIRTLKQERSNNERRQDEVALFAAAGTLEMAKLVAQYTADDAQDQEDEALTQQSVDAIERAKAFQKHKDYTGKSIGKLYDTVMWSVASNNLGLSTSGSTLYSSDFGSHGDGCYTPMEEEEDDDDDDKNREKDKLSEDEEPDVDDDVDCDDHAQNCMTPIGKMHARQLSKDLRLREKALLKNHRQEIRAERREYKKTSQILKAKHQAALDKIVEASVVDRETLRESINERMEALAQRQEESIDQMRRKDLNLTREALFAEDQRIHEAETASFRKAQELISAQVFHEVRNALSSVVAMSEMTTSLKADKFMTPGELVSSVDKMLDQIGDVVHYSLKMLNEILDVSKINSGAFLPKNDAFDLQKVVARATRMQQAKAMRINLVFRPPPQPCIAVSDPSIVERLVATLISNAVKFTPVGAVQPFIWPLEGIQHRDHILVNGAGSTASSSPTLQSSQTTGTASESSSSSSSCDESLSKRGPVDPGEENQCENELQLGNHRMKFVAVGVADTGNGLTEEKLQSAKFVISTSTSRGSSHGAQNTGFGLYHAHLQTRALNTRLRLASLEDCRELLNENMLEALEKKKKTAIVDAVFSSSNGIKECEIPGVGTVLYFTVPVYEDGKAARKALQKRKVANKAKNKALNRSNLIFRPLPSPSSSDGFFKILVADDVLMLRKGMVHTIGKLWTENFPDCPVSVSTACTAEDALRAANTEPFDLIICDNHFMLPVKSKINVIDTGGGDADANADADPDADSKNDNNGGGGNNNNNNKNNNNNIRPHLRYDKTNDCPQDTRRDIKSFFDNECFTVEEGDGYMLGLDALIQLSESESKNSVSKYPKPMLMLVSGQSFELDPALGIVVALKPLKQSEFIQSVERHAVELFQAGICQRSLQKEETLVNGRGSQLFVRAARQDEQG